MLAVPDTCSLAGCKWPPRWRPVLLIIPARAPDDFPPDEIELGAVLCERHRQTTRVDELVTPTTWGTICYAQGRRGAPMPDAGRMRVGWLDVAPPEASA